jgi:alpha-D-ribose 1-methylphosphonate 5-triphosphate synthase subunit PhnG
MGAIKVKLRVGSVGSSFEGGEKALARKTVAD